MTAMVNTDRSRYLVSTMLGSVLALSCGPADDEGTSASSSSASASASAPTTAPAEGSSGAGPTTSGGSSGAVDPTGLDPSTSEASGATSLITGPTPDLPPQCRVATEPCEQASDCCVDAGLTCDQTTLGQVCCGLDGTPCSTPNGEDCCGDRLCVAGSCISPDAAPLFKAPYLCGQSWTYSHHDTEVRRALDFVNNGGETDGAPVLASLEGWATRHYEGDGAGNYVVIDHGGGWTTYYFHLQSFSVEDQTFVAQGQEIGLTGTTGQSSGPHIHYEQLQYGVGKDIQFDGQSLAPYPGQYGQLSHASTNCP
jgi:hypothetical protein